MKGVLITALSVIALALVCVFGVQGCQNGAINREENVNQSLEVISTEQDTLFNVLEEMGSSVEHGTQAETAFQTTIAQMRSGATTQERETAIFK